MTLKQLTELDENNYDNFKQLINLKWRSYEETEVTPDTFTISSSESVFGPFPFEYSELGRDRLNVFLAINQAFLMGFLSSEGKATNREALISMLSMISSASDSVLYEASTHIMDQLGIKPNQSIEHGNQLLRYLIIPNLRNEAIVFESLRIAKMQEALDIAQGA